MLRSIFEIAILLAGVGHFCILGASYQVPKRLGWKEDLKKLSPFNHKLMWTYGGFTVFTIVAFGSLTLFLRKELLEGDRSALALATFIGLFWSLRILVDFFYFEHADWPRGRMFVIGHFFLTGLFICLAATYLGLVVFHFMGAF